MAETTANDIQNELTTGTPRTGIITRTGGAISELRRMANQPAVKRAMPAVAAIAVVFVGLLAYLIFQILEGMRIKLFCLAVAKSDMQLNQQKLQR